MRVLATSDLHMHILPYDYVADLPSDTVGLARTAALIRTARAEAANVLLFDNGDFLHGTPMSEELVRAEQNGETGPTRAHPIVTAMAQLGYDAITLGNHDFDHGLSFLGSVLAQAPFPIVTSNLTLTPAQPPLPGLLGGPAPVPGVTAVPFAILEREVTDTAGAPHRIKIGLLGFLPPGSVTALNNSPFRPKIRDIVHTARTMVPHLHALGADLVLALAHSGIGDDDHVEGMENAIVPLAAIDGIDAVISGHAHQVFPDHPHIWARNANPETGQIHGKPVVAPGFWGSHLGIIDLRLRRTADGRWSVASSRVEARPISVRDAATGHTRPRVTPDPDILDMMARLHDFTLDRVRRPVGSTRLALHSYFAAVAPSSALDIVLRAKTRYVAERLAGTPLADLPLVASTAPFKSGGIAGPGFYTHVPAGEITMKSLTDLYLYPNDMSVLRCTGAELTEWIERSASVFSQILPGRGEQTLLSRATPVYCYEVLSGIDYEIDLTQPPRYSPNTATIDRTAHRVRQLRLAGRPLDPEDELLLLTNSFRVTGGGGYPLIAPERLILDLTMPVREVLIEYLAANDPYDTPPADNWRFTPVPGASARFSSAPAAAGFLAEIRGREITAGPLGKDGFRRFWMKL